MEQKTVLIAEDQSDIGEALETVLTEAGFAVTRVEDGEAALAAAQNEKPAIILLDINMPELNGIEVLQKLRAQPDFAHTPVTIFTAQDDMGTLSEATMHGGMYTDFMSKTEKSLEEIVTHVTQRVH